MTKFPVTPCQPSAPLRKSHPLIKLMNNLIIDLPAPINLSIWWNFGSILGLCLTIQLITGIMLAMHYIPHSDLAFDSIAHIMRDVNKGWLLRSVHANGASLFFFAMYIHVGRGVYYASFLLQSVWYIGVILFILTMATAFLGYVLPWGQMSFWAATVITNFFSAIPFYGVLLVQWIWGGFAVGSATLTRFFTFHFILPFILIVLTALHLMFLHETGSNNPLGMNSSPTKVPFFPYYIFKDLLGFAVVLLPFFMVVLWFPFLFTEPENFIPANPLSTPIHIKPEWYFLWAYTILRSIPNKLGGVTAMLLAILILLSMPHAPQPQRQGSAFYPPSQSFFWSLISVCLLLTWIGGKPVEAPYEALGQMFTLAYFSYFFLHPLPPILWDKLIDY